MLGMIKKAVSSLTPNVYTVYVEWDGEAGMLVAYSDDIPGLATEAPDPETLKARVYELASDILGEQGQTKQSGMIALENKPMYISLGDNMACA